MSITHTPYLEDTYGIDRAQADAMPVEVQEIYAKILLVIAGADGISTSEREYFTGWLRAIGHPETLSRQLLGFDPRHADVDEMLEHFKTLLQRTVEPRIARLLLRAVLYDGARVASMTDAYSAEERAEMRRVGKVLGIDASMVAAIETQVELEASLLEVGRAVRESASDAVTRAIGELDAAVRKTRIGLLGGTRMA